MLGRITVNRLRSKMSNPVDPSSSAASRGAPDAGEQRSPGRDKIRRYRRGLRWTSVATWSWTRRIGVALRKIAVWGGLGTFAGFVAAFVGFMVELEDRQSARVFKAWEVAIAASDSAGTRGAQVDGRRLYETNSSSRKALEFLNRDFNGRLCGSFVRFVSEATTGNSRRVCVFPRKQRESLKGMRLSKLNLDGAWLPGAELTFGRLDQVSLEEANLRKAILQHAVLTRARLRGADLRGARLQGADLSDADLRDADLQGADLRCNSVLNGVRRYTNLLRARGLTCSQLGQANGWEDSFRDPDLACGEEIPDHRRLGREQPGESARWDPDCL